MNDGDFTRSRFDAEEKRDHAKEGKYHQGLFASAFKMACEAVVAARESGGNKGAKQCCRDAEKKYGLPVNTLKYARINEYVRNPPPEGFVPMARGPNAPDSLVNAILDAVASDIQITTLKGDPINPDDVKDKLQDIFRLAGLPYKSKYNLWNKLRARHPDAVRCKLAVDGREHVRLLWTTTDNLKIWHAGYVENLVTMSAVSAGECG